MAIARFHCISILSSTSLLLFRPAHGQECSAAAAAADELLGTANCPCIFNGYEYDDDFFAFKTASGAQATPASVPSLTWFNQSLYPDGHGAFTNGEERPYGYLCGTHDWGTDPWCTNMTDPDTLSGWCADKWCWVDPANCDLAYTPSAYYPNDAVSYSYAACGAANQYVNTEGLDCETCDTGEKREKLKEQIVRTFVEGITELPAQDAFVQLLEAIGQADVRDYEELRKAMYFQAKHLLRDAGASSASFASLHIADSRGMWYKIFPNLNVGMRMPDPATADMYPEEWWFPFTATTSQQAAAAGLLRAEGSYSDSCTDPGAYCNWPSWTCSDTSAEACDQSTCCVTDQLYLETSPSTDDESQPGELYELRQDDPRISAWYYNAVIQYALTGQKFAWSDITPVVAGSSTRLTITATIVIPGDSGSDGAAATSGTCVGGWYAGADFSVTPGTLDVVVDGASHSITLSTDLTAVGDAIDALNAGLGANAAADLDPSGRIRITSASIGSGSTVLIDGNADVAKQMSFSSSITTVGSDPSAGTVIVERVPHRAAGPSAPQRVLDPAPWEGFDFSQNPEEMVITVDGTNVTVTLDSNYEDYADLVVAINTELGAAGQAALDADGKLLTITSSTTGPLSSVQIGAERSELLRKMVCPVIKSTLAVDLYLDTISEVLSDTFAADTVYIVDRTTALLVAESAGEGVIDDDGNQKCAVNAETEWIRLSARSLENLGEKWSTSSLKLDVSLAYLTASFTAVSST